jgi:glycosyltransferase involved in cell wall biosynthesis
MIRVGIDLSPLVQTRAGTARHMRGLLPCLESEPEIALERFSFAATTRPRTLWLDTVWYLRTLPRLAARAACQVLHCPTYRAPVRSQVPLVVSVHDLAVFRHPEAFNRWSRRYAPLVVPRVLRVARRVIAVSQFTASELVSLLGVGEDKIRIVPNAADPLFGPQGEAEAGDYALAVATLEPRKNLARIAEAARLAGLELRVVGASGWGNVRVSGDGVRWLGELPDEELARLYRGARCLVSASLYEGFGLPILEAMASGTPVVTSDRGAMAEVAGGAAVLVDPLDPEAIAAGIREAEARRRELAAAGLEQARKFSWREAARATAAVYREAAG